MSERLDALERALERLSERVAELEARESPDGDGLDVGLLRRLEPDADPGPGVHGRMTYAGSLRVDGRPLVWQRNLDAAQLVASDPGPLAGVLAALGHPDRLAVVRALVSGPRRGPELAGVLGDASTGRLYHHLDKLVAAGVVRQVERGCWEVVPAKVVPVLVLLGAAGDLHAGPG